MKEYKSYKELLQYDNWVKRRSEIVSRDNNKCLSCNNIKLIRDPSIKWAYILQYKETNTDWIILYCYSLPSFEATSLFITKKDASQIHENSIFYYKENENSKSAIIHVRNMLPEEFQEYIDDSIKINKLTEYYTKFYKKINELKETEYVSERKEKKLLDEFTESDEFKQYQKKLNEKRFIKINDDDYSKVSWTLMKGLNVHHKYYQEGKLPWEYPDNALETLCQICHKDLHSKEKIPVYGKEDINCNNPIDYLTACSTCGGSGYRPEFYYYENGICFTCMGHRYIELIP